MTSTLAMADEQSFNEELEVPSSTAKHLLPQYVVAYWTATTFSDKTDYVISCSGSHSPAATHNSLVAYTLAVSREALLTIIFIFALLFPTKLVVFCLSIS